MGILGKKNVIIILRIILFNIYIKIQKYQCRIGGRKKSDGKKPGHGKFWQGKIPAAKSPAGKIPAGKSPGGEKAGGEKSGRENSVCVCKHGNTLESSYYLKPSPHLSNNVKNATIQQSSQTAKFGLSEQSLTMFGEMSNERFRSHCCTSMLTLFERCGESFT